MTSPVNKSCSCWPWSHPEQNEPIPRSPAGSWENGVFVTPKQPAQITINPAFKKEFEQKK